MTDSQDQPPIRVLIVDNDPDTVYLLRQILKIAHIYAVREVLDPREAVHTFLEFDPHLILLDLRMPYLDGFRVLDMLKAARALPLPPVVIISADDSPEAQARAHAAGVEALISDFSDITATAAFFRSCAKS